MKGKPFALGFVLILSTLIVTGCGPTTAPPTPTATPIPPTDGPRTGDVAPDFTLPDSNGNTLRLADELQDNRMVVLVFFHSYG